MDSSKKCMFSDQILSSRRKVLTRFALGIGASLIVLTGLLLDNSLKGPIAPLFQGFYGVGVNSSLGSWRFSLSSPSSTNATGTKEVQSIEGTNVSWVAQKEDFKGANGEGVILEKTHLGNFTQEVKDAKFGVEEGRIEQKTHDANESVIAKNESLLGSDGDAMNLEKTHLRNSPETANTGNLLGEEGKNSGNFSLVASENMNAEEKIEGKSVKNSSDGNSTVTGNNTAGNFSSNGELGRLHGREENTTTAQGNSPGKISTKISYDSQLLKKPNDHYKNCDIYDGKWVRDDSKPYYPAGSCPYIDRDFDCHRNRRPDDGFVKWKWQPNGCDIPSLNATDFIERLRGKNLVFVGDSLNRNMWESLVCILRHSVRNKKRVYEISGKTEFKKKGFYAFRFEDYNCSIDFVGAPFIVSESTFKGKNGSFETLRLDLMDRTTSMYQDADVIVFNTGHWWTHEKTSKGEDYYQEGNHVYPRLKVLQAYTKALTTWARWIDKNIDSSRTQVFFRGYSVTHFRGGPWNSGGQCHKETEPIYNVRYLAKYPSKMRALEHVLQEMKTPVIYMNISRLTDFRKDGHPSVYRMAFKTVEEQSAAESHQDCSHWCLPGVPDTWNELLYASLLKAGRGSWKN